MRPLPRVALYGLLLLLAGRTAAAQRPGPTRILFIGNSLTYYNDLPGLLQRVARLAGDSALVVELVARPDYALEDHWHDGVARQQLERARWDHVVMQQGPSSRPASQDHLREWSVRFGTPIRAAGATPVLYMVWPDASRPADFSGVREGYRRAARASGGIFAPAGEAWRLALERGTPVSLYMRDGFHPTLEGSYLAALVLLSRLRGIAPLSLPATIPGSRADSATVRALQRAAHDALAGWPAS